MFRESNWDQSIQSTGWEHVSHFSFLKLLFSAYNVITGHMSNHQRFSFFFSLANSKEFFLSVANNVGFAPGICTRNSNSNGPQPSDSFLILIPVRVSTQGLLHESNTMLSRFQFDLFSLLSSSIFQTCEYETKIKHIRQDANLLRVCMSEFPIPSG